MLPPIDKNKELIAYAAYLDHMHQHGFRPVAIVYAMVDNDNHIKGAGFYPVQETTGAPYGFFSGCFQDIVNGLETGDGLKECTDYVIKQHPFKTDN